MPKKDESWGNRSISGEGRKRKASSQTIEGDSFFKKSTKHAKYHSLELTPSTTPQDSGCEGDVPNIADFNDTSDEHVRKGNFKQFHISKVSRKILRSRGVHHLFPIQYMTFDAVYETKDVIGQARTGTGKTLSFVLPLIERLIKSGGVNDTNSRPPIVLVMAPTRELANQVKTEFTALAQGLSVFCIYGGVPYEPQELAMKRGIDILVGTPGRILDHVQRGNLDLSQLQCLILDEADQMLEKGFADTMDEILGTCFHEGRTVDNKPQMLLFSATIPEWVQETADKYMSRDRVIVDLVGKNAVRTAINVEHKALCCYRSQRPPIICDIIQVYSGAHGRTMVFTSTKIEANELALNSVLKQECQVLHGDIPQQQREITLKSFREGKFPVLVATDVAARGLDIPEVDLVIQCEPPMDIDAYIHRSGRTGRAGRTGTCVMFYQPNQEYMIPLVEKKARIHVQRISAPQSSDIVKAAGDDAIRCIESVSESLSSHFKKAAEQLIDEKGAESALCAALAYISGFSEFTSRSLLTSEQGFTTFMLTGTYEVRGPGYFWKVLERKFGDTVKNAARGMRMCCDNMGAVFDIPDKLAQTVKEKCGVFQGITLSQPETLPELKPRPQDFYYKQQQQSRARNARWMNGRGGAKGRSRTFGRK